jgi:antitoxin component YwqK of YwqJK toxin-antitoxin module
MQREYYDTGELQSEVFVINGKKEGKCKIYYAKFVTCLLNWIVYVDLLLS